MGPKHIRAAGKILAAVFAVTPVVKGADLQVFFQETPGGSHPYMFLPGQIVDVGGMRVLPLGSSVSLPLATVSGSKLHIGTFSVPVHPVGHDTVVFLPPPFQSATATPTTGSAGQGAYVGAGTTNVTPSAYSGQTTVTGGVLQIGSVNQVPTNTNIQFYGGTLSFDELHIGSGGTLVLDLSRVTSGTSSLDLTNLGGVGGNMRWYFPGAPTSTGTLNVGSLSIGVVNVRTGSTGTISLGTGTVSMIDGTGTGTIDTSTPISDPGTPTRSATHVTTIDPSPSLVALPADLALPSGSVPEPTTGSAVLLLGTAMFSRRRRR